MVAARCAMGNNSKGAVLNLDTSRSTGPKVSKRPSTINADLKSQTTDIFEAPCSSASRTAPERGVVVAFNRVLAGHWLWSLWGDGWC